MARLLVLALGSGSRVEPAIVAADQPSPSSTSGTSSQRQRYG